MEERCRGLLLVDNSFSEWKIIVGSDALASEKYAAEELQQYLDEITGVRIPIIDDNTKDGDYEIVLGNNNRVRKINFHINEEKLGSDGFVIRTAGRKLIIAGGKPRGTLYGVYTFLEDYLGCRWFSSKVRRIPKKSRVEIPSIDVEQVPALEYREPYYFDAFDGKWAARNKANGHFQRLEQRHGGGVKYFHFVHTFDSLVPVEQYYDTHPEFFSEVGGKRIRERTQLCLTNPAVLRIAITRVRQWIRENPDAVIFSVSQNDWYNPCQCPKCREIDEREESHSGTLIYFVNEIAEAIGKEFPDKYIDTLAYQYTRKPPKTVRPRKNVIVRLCSIECCFSHPLPSCQETSYPFKGRVDEGSSFAQDIREWAKICNRLYVWDYVTNFAHYVMPFPNFQVLKPNIQFLVNNNVKGIFEEGNYAEGGGGEFAELRAYVLAKLLWNPDYDTDLAIDEFLSGYYGMAAAPIRAYIHMLQEKLEAGNIHMGIYDSPTSDYLSKDIMEKAVKLFDRAEALADNEEVLNRVRIARLPIEYVILSTMPKEETGRQERIDKFFLQIEEAGITEIREGRPLEQSKKTLEEGTI